ncbi:MAG: hypothetical protein WDN10_05555 [bacterium]
MKLTRHARECIEGRTAMLPQDVLTLIESDAAVKLGSQGEYEYLLFYSPFDRQAKIAIVTKEQTHLISIWEKDYHLPDGIRPPTHGQVRKAKAAYLTFIFKRTAKYANEPHTKKPSAGLPYFQATIEIQDACRTILAHEAGTVTRHQGTNGGRCRRALRKSLAEIASIVEAHKDKAEGAIRYVMCLRPLNGTNGYREYIISHTEALKCKP